MAEPQEVPYARRWVGRAIHDAYMPFGGKVGFWLVVIGLPILALVISAWPGRENAVSATDVIPFVLAGVVIFFVLLGYQLLRAPGRMDAELRAERAPGATPGRFRWHKTSRGETVEGEGLEADEIRELWSGVTEGRGPVFTEGTATSTRAVTGATGPAGPVLNQPASAANGPTITGSTEPQPGVAGAEVAEETML